MMLVEAITIVRYNVYLAERFLHGNKLIFIHPTTNLYGRQKKFAHLDHWFYASNRPSYAMIQILNFGEDEIVFKFYAYGL